MSIQITKKVAFELVKEAARLFGMGTGIQLEPMDELGTPNEGFIDQLDPDPESDVRYGVNLFLNFIRTVHGILNHALLTTDMDLLENEEL